MKPITITIGGRQVTVVAVPEPWPPGVHEFHVDWSRWNFDEVHTAPRLQSLTERMRLEPPPSDVEVDSEP